MGVGISCIKISLCLSTVDWAAILAQPIGKGPTVIARIAGVRAARVQAPQAYSRGEAAEWDRIRRLHAADDAVEAEIRALLLDRPFRSLLDLGTGTGRILELFGSEIERGLGIDLSRE